VRRRHTNAGVLRHHLLPTRRNVKGRLVADRQFLNIMMIINNNIPTLGNVYGKPLPFLNNNSSESSVP